MKKMEDIPSEFLGQEWPMEDHGTVDIYFPCPGTGAHGPRKKLHVGGRLVREGDDITWVLERSVHIQGRTGPSPDERRGPTEGHDEYRTYTYHVATVQDGIIVWDEDVIKSWMWDYDKERMMDTARELARVKGYNFSILREGGYRVCGDYNKDKGWLGEYETDHIFDSVEESIAWLERKTE